MTNSEIYTPAWSVSRKARMDFCPRAAIMHYRETPQRNSENTSTLQLEIRQIHRRISDERFLRDILLYTMQKQFINGCTDPEQLHIYALQHFDNEFALMACGRSQFFLNSLTGNNIYVEDKRRELSGKLQKYTSALSDGAWRSLLKIPVEYRKRFSGILKINVGELSCLTTVLCAFINGGRLWIVELRSGDFSAYESELGMIHRSYALNMNWSPDKVDSLVLDYHSGQMYKFNWENDISAAMGKIADEISRWEAIWELPLEEIPGNTDNCLHCGFTTICRKLKK